MWRCAAVLVLTMAAGGAASASDWEDCRQAEPTLVIDRCSRFIDADPADQDNLAAARTLRGLALTAQGRFDEAVLDFDAVIALRPADPDAYHYNSVGYIALGAAVQESDLAATFERQERIGYRSELIAGEAEVP